MATLEFKEISMAKNSRRNRGGAPASRHNPEIKVHGVVMPCNYLGEPYKTPETRKGSLIGTDEELKEKPLKVGSILRTRCPYSFLWFKYEVVSIEDNRHFTTKLIGIAEDQTE
jgi:hypothetical protein